MYSNDYKNKKNLILQKVEMKIELLGVDNG